MERPLPKHTAFPSLGAIVAGSLILGLVVAVFLVAVPFAGARENVITASVLLAFALGWAALAALSTAWTDQPQRWAVVPAVTMVLVGIGLIAWPGAVEQDWIAWSWPVGALALVCWMVVQARRALHGRAAWPVYVVLGVAVLAAIAGITECVFEAQDRRSLPMPGRLVDVGGYRLHLNVHGEGSPAVVLISGFGDLSSEWGWIAPVIARDTRVCTFDRAGRGWSESAAGPQDGEAIATDLHTLLERGGVPGPYVLVGHSLGGLNALTFAVRYPADVAGMVLLDSTHPGMFTRLATYPTVYEVYRRVSATFPSLARIGVGRVAYRSRFDPLPAGTRKEQKAIWSTARFARSQRDEWATAPVLMKQSRALRSLEGRPLIVVTAGREAQNGWMPLQNELAALSTNSAHRVLPQVEHSELVYERDHATSATQAIRDVVQAVRSGRQLVK